MRQSHRLAANRTKAAPSDLALPSGSGGERVGNWDDRRQSHGVNQSDREQPTEAGHCKVPDTGHGSGSGARA